MTRADIIRMAREAGFEIHERKQQARVGVDALLGIDSTEKLERFAALVAAADREAYAKAADDQWVKNPNVSGGDAIRARNQQTGAAS
jgi:hypothetical protein